MQVRSPYWLLLLLSSACVPDAASEHDDDLTSGQQASCPVPYAHDLPVLADGSGLHIAQVVSDNDGVILDELGETDDWIMLRNEGEAPVQLSRYVITDSGRKPQPLPSRSLLPKTESHGVWADGQRAQGASHVDFKLDAGGEIVTLWADPCTPIDRVVVPALATNESYVRGEDGRFDKCRYVSPSTPLAGCKPAPAPGPYDTTELPRFTWPSDFPRAPSPLAITELALRPASFVEVQNTSGRPLSLADFALRLAAIAPGLPYPGARGGALLGWPVAQLAPGARAVLRVPEAAVAAIAAGGGFEGVASLFGPDGAVIDRVDFNGWPEGAALARAAEPGGPFRLCAEHTPGAANRCTPVRRTPPDALRALHTPEDFAALSAGATELGQAPVKFIVDMAAGDAVHFLSDRWALHYTFVRERIERQAPLDRCDPAEAQEFYDGWVAFSDREYNRTEGRRYLLGTLVAHANGLHSVEFASGDMISAAQMRRAFLAVVARTDDPRAWKLRPVNSQQVAMVTPLSRELPAVGPGTPFLDLKYQPLTPAVGFGVLRFVAAAELSRTHLPAQTIVVTDDVPNDVPFVGGLITELFQTPLAHVNVLSQARGTPNMALAAARDDPRLAPLFGKLVRLEVGPQDFAVREASVAEADAYFESRRPHGPPVVAPSDLRVRGIVQLPGRSLADLPAIGAKAAQFAELYRVVPVSSACADASFVVPNRAFALPLAHYAEHFTASGAAALLRARRAEPAFRADPDVRAAALSAVRDAIARHPVEPALLREVEDAVRERWGNARVRFRSSSNVEDLPTFSGAGLHTSLSAELGDDARTVADALRTVWGSLWNLRAYDEREAANLDHDAARMGVLVHEAQRGELAQGVGISRDLLNVTRDDVYYINAQRGEATVTNPAPGVTTEQLLYTTRLGEPEVRYQTRSSLSEGQLVLDAAQLRSVACALEAVHAHYRLKLDPDSADRLFAMQIEFKFERAGSLVVKQARPQPFGHVTPPADCR